MKYMEVKPYFILNKVVYFAANDRGKAGDL